VLRGGWRFAAALVEVTGRAAVLMVAASTWRERQLLRQAGVKATCSSTTWRRYASEATARRQRRQWQSPRARHGRVGACVEGGVLTRAAALCGCVTGLGRRAVEEGDRVIWRVVPRQSRQGRE
jgi:hypothetical protein